MGATAAQPINTFSKQMWHHLGGNKQVFQDTKFIGKKLLQQRNN